MSPRASGKARRRRGDAGRDGGDGADRRSKAERAPRRAAAPRAAAPVVRRASRLGLLAVQEHERRAIARELHDHFGQVLTAAVIELDAGAGEVGGSVGERLAAVAAELRGLLGDLRDLTLRLRPPLIDEVGLEPALRWLAARVASVGRIEVGLDLAVPEPRLDPEREIAVFRIVQEACTNALRHAAARRLSIALAVRRARLELTVHDDGSGFVPGASRAGQTRGLAGMRERARLVGGELEIDSAPGRGTRIALRVPLARGRAGWR